MNNGSNRTRRGDAACGWPIATSLAVSFAFAFTAVLLSRLLLLVQNQANHLLTLASEPAALVGDPDAPAEKAEVLRCGAEQIAEAVLRNPPAVGAVAHVLPDLGEDVDDEVALRARELLLHMNS